MESKEMSEIRFWWVRHAPVIGNNGCCYGNNDVDCDTSDVSSYKVLANILPKNAITYSSHLTRTIKTMEATIKEGFQYKDYIVDSNFGEQNLGEWQGLKYEKLEEKTRELGVFHSTWLCSPEYTPPQGESYNNLYKRVTKGINRIIEKNKEGDIIIFSHGGPIKAAIAQATKADPSYTLPFWIDNLAVSRFDFLDGVCRVRFINLLPKIISDYSNVYERFI